MSLWSIRYDRKLDAHAHTLTPAVGRAPLVPIAAGAFRVLGVSASLAQSGGLWWSIHTEANVLPFEIEHGREPERVQYNQRTLARAVETKRPVLGSHGGMHDFFVPVVVQGEVIATLVSGPFLRSRPTRESILKGWRWLSGRAGHFSDPQFAAYLSALLNLLVLDGEKLAWFERFLSCFADLMSDRGSADDLVSEADLMRAKLEPARSAEHSWNAVQSMLDDRTQRTWATVANSWNLTRLGLSRAPDHVLVGLNVSREHAGDPVETAVRLDAFQRAAVELAKRTGNALAGRVGERGVVFLSAAGGSANDKRQKLLELADRVHDVGRKRFGLSLHFGVGAATRSLPLSRSYHDALFLAERALAEGVRLLTPDSAVRARARSLRELRRELGRSVRERPTTLGAEFDRYLEAVELESRHEIEAARGHLDAGFERILEPLLGEGALDEKSYQTLTETLDRTVLAARTLGDLFAAYRRAVSDLSDAVSQPVEANRDRSLGRVLDHIHQHFTEPLSFPKLAKLAGFAPAYFSQLFKRHEGVSFEAYVLRLRVERAKQLLESTELEALRIGELSGFHSAQYFSRAFRKLTGATPGQYRKRFARRRAPQKAKRPKRASVRS